MSWDVFSGAAGLCLCRIGNAGAKYADVAGVGCEFRRGADCAAYRRDCFRAGVAVAGDGSRVGAGA